MLDKKDIRKWKKLPEFSLMYELNIEGQLRNIKSKKIVKPRGNRYSIRIKGQLRTHTVTTLLLKHFENELIRRMNRIGFKQIRRYFNHVKPYYFINSNGDILSLKHYTTRKPVMDVGYPRVNLATDNGPKKILMHRLVAEIFIPNPENKKEVNHKNRNIQDYSLENLEWTTPSENVRHRHLIKDNREIGKLEYAKLTQNLHTSTDYLGRE